MTLTWKLKSGLTEQCVKMSLVFMRFIYLSTQDEMYKRATIAG